MWWGGFSESLPDDDQDVMLACLNPHVVGRFFRAVVALLLQVNKSRLNPHVVGRFFRVVIKKETLPDALSS